MRRMEFHGALKRMGGKYPPEYTAWKNMRRRCTAPSAPNYPHYGGRGITVCDRWLHSYAAFLADMGPRPSLKTARGHSLYTLERVDNNRGYEPDNCIWATYKVQMRNKRRLKKHEQAPYWMKRNFGGEEYYLMIFPKNTPPAWYAEGTR